jgi:hypothetical protein
MRIPSCLLALIGAVPAQTLIPVNGGGAALQVAANAAPNGSVLVVAPGQYDGFTVVDKDLTIHAPNRATIIGPMRATAGVGTPQRALTLIGLDVASAFAGPSTTIPGRILAQDHLHVQNCTCEGIQVVPAVSGGSRTVVIADTTVRAGPLGGGGVRIEWANAVATDSSFTGGLVASSQGTISAMAGLILVQCDLRAERLVVTGGSNGASHAVAVGAFGGVGTIADSQLLPGGPGAFSVNWVFGTCTLWSTSTPGGGATVASRPLARAAWQQQQWTTGGTSSVVLTEVPSTAMAMVASLQAVPWTTPAALETLWIGATPDWVVTDFGPTDAQGRFTTTFMIPNVPSLRYTTAWLCGIAFDPLPLRSSAPIGGTIL